MRSAEIPAGSLVGRVEQLAVLRGLIVGAGGTADAVLVEGEPGIGRTRFLSEVSTLARDAGMPVLSGLASPGGEALPYGLITDVLAGVPEGGPGLPDILAQIGRRTAGTAAGDRIAACPIDQDRLGRDLIHVLTGLPGRAGVAVLVDDVHLADRESTDMLRYLVRHQPSRRLMLVLTCRVGRCPSALMAALSALGPRFTRLTLPPLTDADLTRLLPGTSVDRRRALWLVSAGNPRYLLALAAEPDATLAAIARGEYPDRPLAHPSGESITAEIRALPDALRHALQAAAVIGCDLGIEAVAYVAGEPVGIVERTVDALANRDVLRVDAGQFDFRHAVVRAAAYWSAGPAWRARAHTRAAAYLQERGASLAQLAPHLAHSASLGDAPSAQALAAAAQEAMGTAPGTSLTWLQAAARILPNRPDAALQTMQGRALVLSAQFDHGTSVLRQVTGVAGPHRVTAVEHLAQLERLLGRYAQARALLTTELPRAGSDHAQAMLRLELAATELFECRYGPAAEHAYAALAIARRDDHRGIEAAAAAVVAACALGTRPLAGAVARISHAQELFDALPDTALREELGGFALLSWAEYITGRRAVATLNIERGLRVARDYGREHALPQLLLVRAELHLADGRTTEAITNAEEATTLAQASGSAELKIIATSMALRPRLWRDGVKPVRRTLADFDRSAPQSPWFRAETAIVLGEVHLALDDPLGCRSVLAAVDAGGLKASGPPAATVFTLRARATDDSAHAHGLLTYAERAAAGLPFYRGQVSSARAQWAMRDGHTAAAVDHGQAAVADYEAAGVPLWEGQARMQVAEALGVAGNIDAARRELGLAKSLFAAGDAGWLEVQSGRAQRQLSAKLSRGASDTRLTTRELQVAALVTGGLTNSAIARELVLSERTIETHLARIFNRLGLRSRAAVAHWYTTRELAGSVQRPPRP